MWQSHQSTTAGVWGHIRFNVLLANITNGLERRIERLCNLSIGFTLVGEQQHVGVLEFASATVVFVMSVSNQLRFFTMRGN